MTMTTQSTVKSDVSVSSTASAVSAAAAAAAPVVADSAASTWEIDASHSTVQFSVRHMMVSTVRGQFSGVTGTLFLDERDVAKSKVDVSIDATTINTREEKRDAHLRSPDFFDVERFPKVTFSSTKVTAKGDGRLSIEGDLAMHGVSKRVTLEVEGPTPAFKNPWGKVVRGASASTKINRKDWGLGWNVALETGGILVGEEVTLHLDIELTKTA
jgi:polyisoprenoid-binding protein YceI